ncbi:MAG: hypothetical protein IJ759_00120 [Bacteroidales bacterium]|nr:hypothetical protein [Bacteroidales bacterium]
MKEFNLEEAKAGKPVCTADGRKARIVCFDLKNNHRHPLIVLIEDYESGEEHVYYYTEQGSLYGDKNWQLVMKTEKKTGWVFLCEPISSKLSPSSTIYESKEKAEKAGKLFSNYVGVAKIEMEEYDNESI